MSFLALNIGSSSIKYAMFDLISLTLINKGEIECDLDDSERNIKELIKKIPLPSIVIHRIVHGGDKYTKATLLNDKELKDLEEYSPFAPLHQPHNINGVRILKKLFPNMPQYGCFDTAFHAEHDDLHSTFAISKNLREKSLKRYGFHGLSYDWISRQVNAPRMVIAHLGSGASLCALLNGKSIDSTMGLTTLDGLPMATRSGSIDAGLVLYLSQHLQYTAEQIESILYSESGLKGLSGISGDVQTLLKSNDMHAKFAIHYFCFKTAQHVAMMAVSLGGLDKLVFTGGVGENAESIRTNIVSRLSFMSPFETQVIKTNEEQMMAIQVQEVIDTHA